MRIRHVLPEFTALPGTGRSAGVSGIACVALSLAKEQASRGHSPELVGPCPAGGSAMCAPTGVPSISVPLWRWLVWHGYDLRYIAPAALTLLGKPRVELLHVHSNPYLLALPGAEHRILHCHTPVKGVPDAYSRAVSRADAVVCCSEFTRQQFLQNVAYPSCRTFVVHNGVDVRAFSGGAAARYPAVLGLPATRLVLLYVGHIGWEKGLIYLVQALAIMAASLPVHLVVVGSCELWHKVDGPAPRTLEYAHSVRELASTLPVSFVGELDHWDLPRYYWKADVVVCPSVWEEPFGMVILEAMAAGKPVVASNVGGIPEVVQDGVTGLLVPPANPQAIAQAVARLAGDEGLRARMGSAGRKRARLFDWSRVAALVEDVYGRLTA